MHHLARSSIVRADDGVRFQLINTAPKLACLVATKVLNQRGFKRCAANEQGLAVTGDSCFNGGGRMRVSHEGDTLATEPKQVLRDHVPCAPVVNCNEVITAALWIWQKTAVK